MKALGRALAVLRARSGLFQAQAGQAFGTSGQGWAKYENGQAASIFKPSVQARLAAAVGATVGELLDEVERQRPKPADEDWVSRNFLEAADPQ